MSPEASLDFHDSFDSFAHLGPNHFDLDFLLPHPSAAIVATFVAIAALRVEVALAHLPDTSVESSQVSSDPPLPLGTCWPPRPFSTLPHGRR